ncbi:hypothetical protein HD597_005466 [Nonomuraea thailandensis]|uniref:DUF624 domain-containing protein n=1 Tax=Nonomuraea thailandensis TaxID=1188745 RepID=A0A9X2GGG5_9ACTN|nr:hypothetical protein [Nonomuraea thailandensis]MCP2358446.1 hypothetical protein [Nonomuraea thailandensis]
MTLLTPDGALMRAWSRWWLWAWTSGCWLLLSLPVITAPAATLWLVAQQRRRAAGEAPLGAAETARFLGRQLLPALRLAGCHAGIAALVLAGLLGPSPGGPYGWLVLITSVVAGATWLLVAPWSVPAFAQTGRALAALRAAYVLALSRIESALLATAAVIAAVAAPLVAIRVPYLGPLLVVALPAATASLVISLYDRAAAARTPSSPAGPRPAPLLTPERGPR